MLFAQKIFWKQRDQDWEPAVALTANFLFSYSFECLFIPLENSYHLQII